MQESENFGWIWKCGPCAIWSVWWHGLSSV